jgi:glucose uptake protein GlcU
MVSVLDGCTESCGWAAAILAVFAWGTFGVPLKVNTDVEVNFFVMQSYKTIVCFLTSFLVILLGEPVRWTPWGIVSGIFWVPGAACGIFGIRNAGIAVAVGTWSSIQVVVSCVFGIIIFQEKFKNTQQTLLAICCLMIGLIGMSRYSETPKPSSPAEYQSVATQEMNSNSNTMNMNTMDSHSLSLTTETNSRSKSLTTEMSRSKRKLSRERLKADHADEVVVADVEPLKLFLSPMEMEVGKVDDAPLIDDKNRGDKDRFVLLGGRVVLNRRQMGILGAVFNGAWGGLNLIPLHYAQRDQGLSGAGYLISYGTGSMLVCISIWIGLFMYHFVRRGYSVPDAFNDLPSWHVRELGLPGLMAGIFYSIGNFCSILAVAYLGQGVGFSFCQGQLLISGLWGVFYFKEIQGRETITKWFTSAAVTIVGIIWLSYQHEGGASLHR